MPRLCLLSYLYSSHALSHFGIRRSLGREQPRLLCAVVVQSLPDVVDIVPCRHWERLQGFVSHLDVAFVAASRESLLLWIRSSISIVASKYVELAARQQRGKVYLERAKQLVLAVRTTCQISTLSPSTNCFGGIDPLERFHDVPCFVEDIVEIVPGQVFFWELEFHRPVQHLPHRRDCPLGNIDFDPDCSRRAGLQGHAGIAQVFPRH